MISFRKVRQEARQRTFARSIGIHAFGPAAGWEQGEQEADGTSDVGRGSRALHVSGTAFGALEKTRIAVTGPLVGSERTLSRLARGPRRSPGRPWSAKLALARTEC